MMNMAVLFIAAITGMSVPAMAGNRFNVKAPNGQSMFTVSDQGKVGVGAAIPG